MPLWYDNTSHSFSFFFLRGLQWIMVPIIICDAAAGTAQCFADFCCTIYVATQFLNQSKHVALRDL